MYNRLVWLRHVQIVIPTLQALLGASATYVCISRITDNRHHPSDVITGAFFGVVMAIVTVSRGLLLFYVKHWLNVCACFRLFFFSNNQNQ